MVDLTGSALGCRVSLKFPTKHFERLKPGSSMGDDAAGAQAIADRYSSQFCRSLDVKCRTETSWRIKGKGVEKVSDVLRCLADQLQETTSCTVSISTKYIRSEFTENLQNWFFYGTVSGHRVAHSWFRASGCYGVPRTLLHSQNNHTAQWSLIFRP